jgi:hypothetical protein
MRAHARANAGPKFGGIKRPVVSEHVKFWEQREIAYLQLDFSFETNWSMTCTAPFLTFEHELMYNKRLFFDFKMAFISIPNRLIN